MSLQHSVCEIPAIVAFLVVMTRSTPRTENKRSFLFCLSFLRQSSELACECPHAFISTVTMVTENEVSNLVTHLMIDDVFSYAVMRV